jgi:hypothetical protein
VVAALHYGSKHYEVERMNALLVAAALATSTPAPPMQLPGPSTRATGGGDWIVGAAGRPAAALAARFGARALGTGAYAVPRGRARGFAAALRHRGLLFYAQPDVRMTSDSYDSNPDLWARGAVVPSSLAPPSPTAAPIAVIDDFVDSTLPDLAGHVSYLNGSSASKIEGPHGTEVASVAAAAANGQGIEGILPGATIMSYGVPTKFTCADTVPGILAAIKAKARVINMSYGSKSPCFAEFVALQYALSQGMLAVASSGNEFTEGNPVSYPAGLPHVLSVAALNEDLTTAFFSTANAAVDVAAPGTNVPVDTPLAFDTKDGTADGLSTADGTSFSSPITAGAASWILSARPTLSGAQAGDLLRRTATDVAKPGYDTDTGFGLINLKAAVEAPTPPIDPLEPNDGFEWVDGTAFTKPAPFVWKGGKAFTFAATVDAVEDPLDVYRFRVPGHSHVKLTVKPISGDPAILIYKAGSTKLSQRKNVLAGSSHPGSATETIRLVNHGSAGWGFAVILNDSSAKALDVAYRLGFKRTG